ncbi:MAG: hypothetical protein FJX74_19310, partial [Armatimonadetes bacterium]|nr:hypothetical protein [Armatimonadota bacterium]
MIRRRRSAPSRRWMISRAFWRTAARPPPDARRSEPRLRPRWLGEGWSRMGDVVGVCFKPTGKVYYFSARGLNLQAGERVIAETSRGRELAEVISTAPQGERAKGKLKPILRRATEADILRGDENRHREEEARRVCQRLLRQTGQVVKLVDVEYAFDGTRITFSFASDENTNFQDLQRRLKEIYDSEIEVRQIGVRDQAKILGGLGPCGRHLCCAAFLRNFHPVTIRMAKDQDIALNPTKISGQCGRLMCCLRYEHEQYREARGKLPAVGTQVLTPQGRGEVKGIDVLRQRLTVLTEDGPIEVSLDDVRETAPRSVETPPARRSAPAAEPPEPAAEPPDAEAPARR